MKRVVRSQPVVVGASPLLGEIGALAVWAVVGALLIALAYQVPARHVVNVGYNDAAYVQGFSDPVNRWGVVDPAAQATTPLRWSGERSALIFPQIGLPATATIRWRALPTADGALPNVRVLLNGRDELGAFEATGEWETHTFAIDGGLLKPSDVFLELRTEPAIEIDGVVRGVQVDRAMFATGGWPILPYPAQVAFGAITIVLATALTRNRRVQIGAALGIAIAFLLLYRLQLTPYPLRTLPVMLVLGFAAITAVRTLPALRSTIVVPLLTLAGSAILIGFGAWTLQTAQRHVVLSVPGVEKDFRVFATRALDLVCGPSTDRLSANCVLRADGFYQLGYPFLLWAIQPLTQVNAFLAARVVGALSGVVLLAATWALGRRVLGSGAALLAVIVLALSPLVVQYSLYLGTDMAFAALWAAGLAALLAPQQPRRRWAIAAGALCGAAFLIRHPGLVLLPFGVFALWIAGRGVRRAGSTNAGQPLRSHVFAFVLAWLVVALPQVIVNVADTGSLLYSQQAKNIWLAVYGNTDWNRWDEAANTVHLTDVILADPPRFSANWTRNLQALVGTGADDTSEFGQAIALRLIGFPANWLAVIGLALWLWRGDRRQRMLVGGAALYVLGVSVAFVLPRFFLPLAPIWAIASVTPLVLGARTLAKRWPRLQRSQWALTLGLVLIALLVGGPRIGAQYVLDRQNPDAVAVVQTLQPRLQPGDRVAFALPPDDMLGKYSALAHLAAPLDDGSRFVVWTPAAGDPPPSVQTSEPFATIGDYHLFEQ